MRIPIIALLTILPIIALGQIDSKLLVGSWCVEKITNLPATGQKEVLQTQMMDEFQGVVMLFTSDEYTVYLEDSDEQLFAKYEFIAKENKIKITYTGSAEVAEYKVEKLSKTQLVFIWEDEYGKHRFYMKRCD